MVSFDISFWLPYLYTLSCSFGVSLCVWSLSCALPCHLSVPTSGYFGDCFNTMAYLVFGYLWNFHGLLGSHYPAFESLSDVSFLSHVCGEAFGQHSQGFY